MTLTKKQTVGECKYTMDNRARYERKIEQLSKEIEMLTEQEMILPEGSVSIYRDAGHIRYKGVFKGEQHYYTQSELPLVKKLLLKKYLTLKITEMKSILKVYRMAQRHEQKHAGKATEFLLSQPIRAELLRDELRKKEYTVLRWETIPDSDEAPYQEGRIETTVTGIKVRSKSEVMIASVLFERGLLFRYEDPLRLGRATYYPDFTILRPDSSVIWYEHFGMMDNPDYSKRAYEKLHTYALHGIIPSVNLIVTMETRETPLDLPKIHHALDQFF